MRNFKEYLKEESSTVYFTFGRMNPPTVGHEKLMDKLAKAAKGNPYKVYLSQSHDSKKNPLTYSDKIKHVRKMFPRHGRSVMIDKGVRTAFDVATKLYDQGFKNIVMVVGSDRVTEFKTLLNKYNNVKGRHGFYNFNTIGVQSAGERDPDAEGVEGMSASKQRSNAANNDFAQFSQGLPKAMGNRDAKKLFNDIRKGMGLKEQKSFKNHIELEPVSSVREDYVNGNLYEIGDTVVIKETNEQGKINWLGSNYISVEMKDGSLSRKWISDVEKLDEKIGIVDPVLDRFIDRSINKKKYNNAVKFYLDYIKTHKSSAQQALLTASKVTDTDYRNLKLILKKAIDAGKIDKKFAVEATAPTSLSLAKSRINKDRERISRKQEKEKENAKTRHDRIIDRARLSVAKRKNRKEKSYDG